MVQEHVQEFSELRERAVGLLRDGAWTLRLEVLPSFTDAIALGVIHSGRDWTLVERCWNFEVDATKFSSPIERMKYPRVVQPTMRERSIGVTRDEVHSIMAPLGEVEIPLCPTSNEFGLDGTGYSLVTSVAFARIQISWWQKYPEKWLPAMRVFGVLWRELGDRLGVSTEVVCFPWES